MFCVPVAVSLAMMAASVQASAPVQTAPAGPAAPAKDGPPLRCGTNVAKYRPAEAAAQRYWREQTGRFAAAGAEQKIEVLAAAWAEIRDACFLYFGYRANARQGHHLRAYAQAQELLAVGGAPADVTEYLLEVYEGSHGCEVALKLDDVATPEIAEVQATYEGLTAGDDLTGRCALAPCSAAVSLTQKQHKLGLRVGRWTLLAGQGSEFTPESASPGEPPERRSFVVDDCAAPRSLTLRIAAPRPVAPPQVVEARPPVVAPPVGPAPVGPVVTTPPADMRRPSNVGIGVGAGVLLSGGVLLAVGAKQWSSVYNADLVEQCNGAELNGTANCRAQIGGPTALRTTGAGVLGGGLGLLLPALALRRSTKAQRAAWLPILGGVVTVAGAALIGAATTSFNRGYGAASTTPWEERTAGSMHLHTVGGALTGFGVGLLGGALARCVWRGACGSRAPTVHRASLAVSPGGAALAVSGRF